MAVISKFEYLLNAMENAAAKDRPADHDYRAKRWVVLDYVISLHGEITRIAAKLDLPSTVTTEEILKRIEHMKTDLGLD